MFNNFDPNDPRTAGLMQLAAALMGNKGGNFGQALGQAIPQGLMAYQGAQQNRMRSAEEEQQRKMRELQMGQMQRQADEQQQMRGLAQSAFGPNPNVQNFQGQPMTDDMGGSIPQAPGGGGMPEFARGLMGINPQLGAQFMPKPKEPTIHTRKQDEDVVDSTGRVLVRGSPKAETPYGKLNPADYTVDSFRKFAASGNHADLVPYRKPDTDKPSKPERYDSAGGPVWISPDAPTRPVIGPDGKPLAGKKRDQPLTESQSRGTLFLGQMREADKVIEGLKFKPETTTAQAQLAAALKAKESGTLSGAALNLAAGKDAQQYAQAAEQWAESFLRIKTGAASTRDEVLRNVRTFFPQPGDKPATIKQKNEARKAATKQMEIIAGHGVQQLEAQGGAGKVVDWNDLP